MTDTPTAYPLSWPQGRIRTPSANRMAPRFRTTLGKAKIGNFQPSEQITLPVALDRLERELDAIGAKDAILSSNLQLRLNGAPRLSEPEPSDPGAAAYFSLAKKPIVLASDRWNTVAGNIAAIAAHLDAMRGMERWGVGTAEQLFTGYAALPPSDSWRGVLGDPKTLEDAEASYRRMIRAAHPDTGGSQAAAATLNAAITEARKVLR